jgi:hypothetical protein
MAELGLYFTEEDELIIVAAALEMDCKIIPDVNYSLAQYDSLGSAEEYKRYRSRARLFFFLSEEFFRCPLEMRKMDKEGKTVYYISQRSGGPTIYFLGAGLFDQADEKFIRPGAIGYHSTFENTFTGRMEKPPVQLVNTYKSLVKAVQKSATRIKPGKRVFWLGPDARKAVENVAKLVGFEKYSAQELLKRRQQARNSAGPKR